MFASDFKQGMFASDFKQGLMKKREIWYYSVSVIVE